MWCVCTGAAVLVFVTCGLIQASQTTAFGKKIINYSQSKFPTTNGTGLQTATASPSVSRTSIRQFPAQPAWSPGRQFWPYTTRNVDTKADISFLFMKEKTASKGCGVPALDRVRRIVGGARAGRCSLPWMVYISRDPGKDDLCGGTLVSDRHVITAAHCFDNLGRNWPVLYIGEYNRQSGSPKTRFVTTSYQISVHPYYSRFTFSYDIAILTLNTPIAFENYECMRPICLPDKHHVLRTGNVCTVAGWGSTSRSSESPAVSSPLLMKTQIQVLSDQACKDKFGNLFNGQSQICAGDLTGRTDSCVGDSGGPLMCSMKDSSHVNSGEPQIQFLMGVISSGTTPCAQTGIPALYTDIQEVRPWIHSVVKF